MRQYRHCCFLTKLVITLCSDAGSPQNVSLFASSLHFLWAVPAGGGGSKKKRCSPTHITTMMASPGFMVGMLWDEWWAVPGFPQTQHFSISAGAELRFGFIRPYNLLPHDFTFFHLPLWCCPPMHFLRSGFFLASLPSNADLWGIPLTVVLPRSPAATSCSM